MILSSSRTLLALVFWFVLAAPAGAAGQGLTVDGMEVFYGVVPAEVIRKQTDKHDPSMHRKRAWRSGSHHLVVSIYDTKTGERITDATVLATVTPLGMASMERQLEPMQVNQTVTYGNFFDLPPSSGPFHIVLSIKRPKASAHNTLQFDYRPPGQS